MYVAKKIKFNALIDSILLQYLNNVHRSVQQLDMLELPGLFRFRGARVFMLDAHFLSCHSPLRVEIENITPMASALNY